jgi:hypothetical protein
MTRGKIVVLGMIVVFLLAACESMKPQMSKEVAKPDSGEIVSSTPKEYGEKTTLPSTPPRPDVAMPEEVAPSQALRPQIKEAPKKNGGPAIGAKASAPEVAGPPRIMAAKPVPENGGMTEVMRAPATANGEEEYAVSMADRWNAFLQSFKDAVYTFNPPSPIKVDKPRTMHLWVDTMIDQQALAEELRRIVPWDAERIEAGAIQVSPEMRAILTGENFKIKANSPEQQMINLAGRTIWSWEITPTWPGTQTLHLRLIAIPPDAMSSPYTIPVPLDRTIEVEVTLWWYIDHFFDKYWKWLLGGLGTLFMALLTLWLKKRFGSEKN